MAVCSETGVELLSRLARDETLKELELFSGFSTGRVIEVSGESGCGKSELLYSWIIHTLLPKAWKNIHLGGENGSVVFINTNLQFNIFRLITAMETKIMDSFKRVNVANPSGVELKSFVKSSLSFLHVLHCKNSEQLLITLHSLNDLLPTEKKVKLLIIDSLSSFYWFDKMQKFDHTWRVEEHYNQIVKALSKIIDEHQLTLVATRQLLLKTEKKLPVSDKLGMNVRDFDFLGKLWKKLVTCQVWLSKEATHNKCTYLNMRVLRYEDCRTMNAVINDSGYFIKNTESFS